MSADPAAAVAPTNSGEEEVNQTIAKEEEETATTSVEEVISNALLSSTEQAAPAAEQEEGAAQAPPPPAPATSEEHAAVEKPEAKKPRMAKEIPPEYAEIDWAELAKNGLVEKQKLPMLKAYCKVHGLTMTGNKPDYITRVLAHLKSGNSE